MAKKKVIEQDVLQEFETYKNRRKRLEDRWLDNFKRLYMHESLTKEQIEDIKLGIVSKIRVPIELQAIETKLPRVVNTIFSENPIATAIPNNPFSIKTAPTLQNLVNMYLRNRLYAPFSYAGFQCLYAGTGFIGLEWETNKTVQGNIVEGPRFTFCDLFNTYVPDACLDSSEVDVVYRRLLKKISYIEKVASARGYDLKAIEEAVEKKKNTTINKDSIYMDRLNILGLSVGEKDIKAAFTASDDEQVGELVEKWEKDIVTVCLNGIVIKRSKHMFPDFVPFFGLKNYRNDTMFYGLGEIDIMGDLPDYAREIKDLRMDIIRRVAYPAALVSRTAMIDEDDLVTRPYQIIKTSDMEGYKEVQRPDVKRILVDEEFIAKQGIEDATGIYSYIKGGEAPRAETATTALAMQEAGMERINSMIFYNCETFFKDLCYRLTTTLQKKLDNELFLRFQDPDTEEMNYKTISKEDLLADVTWEISAFKIKSISDINTQQNYMALYDRLIQSPNVNRYYLDKRLLEVFNVKNMAEVLVRSGEAEVLSILSEMPQLVPMVLQFIRAQMPRLQQQEQMQGQGQQPSGQNILPGQNSASGMQVPTATGNNRDNMGGGGFAR